MIETDKEIVSYINRLKENLKVTKRKISFYNIINKTIFIIGFMNIFFFIEGMANFIKNVVLLVVLIWISFFLEVFIFWGFKEYLENSLNYFYDEKINLEKNIEDTSDFIAYLTACRHVTAIKNKENIYPELRYNDSLYVINQYKDIYEEKRIEYEKQHKARIEMNKKQP